MYRPATIGLLERKLESLQTSDPRKAAEYAFALAALARDAGDADQAINYAKTSIKLFEDTSTKTLEECAAINNEIGGIIIPSIIHEGVVRNRFGL